MITTGTILLVSGSITGHDTRADLIQKFQSIKHPESGTWNHTALIWPTRHENRIVEAQSKGVLPASLADYTSKIGEIELLYLVPDFEVNEKLLEDIIMKYIGTPYGTLELIRESVILTTTGKWIGLKGKRAAKRMRCHEFAMFVWHEYSRQAGIFYNYFPEWYKGDVHDIWSSPYFQHRLVISQNKPLP